jgi:hypothetical protein
MTDSDKHCILLPYGISYDRKNFYGTDPPRRKVVCWPTLFRQIKNKQQSIIFPGNKGNRPDIVSMLVKKEDVREREREYVH